MSEAHVLQYLLSSEQTSGDICLRYIGTHIIYLHLLRHFVNLRIWFCAFTAKHELILSNLINVFLSFTGTVLYGDQSAAIKRLVDCEKTSIRLKKDPNAVGARGTRREPLIKRNQYIPNERG